MYDKKVSNQITFCANFYAGNHKQKSIRQKKKKVSPKSLPKYLKCV